MICVNRLVISCYCEREDRAPSLLSLSSLLRPGLRTYDALTRSIEMYLGLTFAEAVLELPRQCLQVSHAAGARGPSPLRLL